MLWQPKSPLISVATETQRLAKQTQSSVVAGWVFSDNSVQQWALVGTVIGAYDLSLFFQNLQYDCHQNCWLDYNISVAIGPALMYY